MEARSVAVVTAASKATPGSTDRRHETQRAFDGVAPTYDRSNTGNTLLCAMRERTRAALERVLTSESHILDLGCGPGTDVMYFAQRGFRVTAIDWSTVMVDETARRIRAAGLDERVCVRHLGIEQLDRLDFRSAESFDAAYSSFGPLNCVTDLASAARAIARQLRRRGHLVASVIGRVCPWEIALYLARADLRRALLRFRSGAVPVPLEGRTVWTQYYTVGAFVRALEPAGFQFVSCRALGLFTPPPYASAFANRHPRLIAGLQRVEDGTGAWPGIRRWGDHFLIVMRRR